MRHPFGLLASVALVALLAAGCAGKQVTFARPGKPPVALKQHTAKLTIVPSARKLYAATHGLSAWSLNLPAVE